MKVLFCLLSDQHVPNLLSVHHYRPDQLVLLESDHMKKREAASHFLKALKHGHLDYGSRHHIEPLAAEDNLTAVRQALQRAYGKFPSAEWIANLTGGTKPMSIATHEFFKALGGNLIYTNVVRPASLIDIESGETQECSHRPSIKEFLAGYGFESRKADDKMAEAERRAVDGARSAELLAQHATDREILSLKDDERRKAREKGVELSADKFHFPREAEEELRKIWFDGVPTRKLTKYEVEFLTGGWLEVFFWNLLVTHSDELGIWDVRLGLEVGRRGDSSGNEFDVAFMHNHGLSMIECKSGSQKHDSGADILYKIEAVTRQFRALRVRSFLATTATNVLDRENKVKESLQVRADIYQCRLLIGNQIRELALRLDDAQTVREVILDGRNS